MSFSELIAKMRFAAQGNEPVSVSAMDLRALMDEFEEKEKAFAGYISASRNYFSLPSDWIMVPISEYRRAEIKISSMQYPVTEKDVSLIIEHLMLIRRMMKKGVQWTQAPCTPAED